MLYKTSILKSEKQGYDVLMKLRAYVYFFDMKNIMKIRYVRDLNTHLPVRQTDGGAEGRTDGETGRQTDGHAGRPRQ